MSSPEEQTLLLSRIAINTVLNYCTYSLLAFPSPEGPSVIQQAFGIISRPWTEPRRCQCPPKSEDHPWIEPPKKLGWTPALERHPGLTVPNRPKAWIRAAPIDHHQESQRHRFHLVIDSGPTIKNRPDRVRSLDNLFAEVLPAFVRQRRELSSFCTHVIRWALALIRSLQLGTPPLDWLDWTRPSNGH